MRYFKCQKTNVPDNAALREQYKKLAEDEKKSYRKEKVLNALAIIVLIFLVTVKSSYIAELLLPLTTVKSNCIIELL